jgi:hypothetical protein
VPARKTKIGAQIVRNPAGKEKRYRCSGEIGRIEKQPAGMHKVACVIEHHDHHHDAAQEID